MKRVHVKISGVVQGVGFRYSLYTKAKLYGLTGWVKNLEDGRVEAVFEGEKDEIEKILNFCKNGPFLAKIKNIEVKQEKYKSENKFRILK